MIPIIFFTISEDQCFWLDDIMSKYHKKLINIAIGYVKYKELAEDVVQNSYIIIIKNMDRIFKLSPSHRIAYVTTIVKNESINYIKNSQREISTDNIDTYMVTTEPGPAEKLIKKENEESLKRALQKLSEEELYFIEYRYVKSLKYSELAKLFGITEEAAKKRGQRILKKLRKYLEKERD